MNDLDDERKKPMTICTLTLVLTIDAHVDEHLQTQKGLEDEVRSWLEGLGVNVHALVVGQLPSPDGLTPQQVVTHQYRFMRVMEHAQQAQKGVLAAWLEGSPR